MQQQHHEESRRRHPHTRRRPRHRQGSLHLRLPNGRQLHHHVQAGHRHHQQGLSRSVFKLTSSKSVATPDDKFVVTPNSDTPYSYDGKTQLLVANPLKRYLLNSTTLKSYKYGPDGSLTFYISHTNPGPAKQPNWLPAPDGAFYTVLRVYLPGDTVVDGTWKRPQMHPVPK